MQRLFQCKRINTGRIDNTAIKLETLAMSVAFSIKFLNEKEYADEIREIGYYSRYIGFEADCKK